jgi:hypothetical protein
MTVCKMFSEPSIKETGIMNFLLFGVRKFFPEKGDNDKLVIPRLRREN